jgi:hypothetical protein
MFGSCQTFELPHIIIDMPLNHRVNFAPIFSEMWPGTKQHIKYCSIDALPILIFWQQNKLHFFAKYRILIEQLNKRMSITVKFIFT